MAKILAATCENSIVKVGGVSVPDVEILSQGIQASTGILIIDGEALTYVATNTTDLADAIDTLNQMVQKLVLITTSLDAVTVSPGTAAANIALLASMNTTFGLTKENLK